MYGDAKENDTLLRLIINSVVVVKYFTGDMRRTDKKIN